MWLSGDGSFTLLLHGVPSPRIYIRTSLLSLSTPLSHHQLVPFYGIIHTVISHIFKKKQNTLDYTLPSSSRLTFLLSFMKSSSKEWSVLSFSDSSLPILPWTLVSQAFTPTSCQAYQDLAEIKLARPSCKIGWSVHRPLLILPVSTI